jgi:hypothetical protein
MTIIYLKEKFQHPPSDKEVQPIHYFRDLSMVFTRASSQELKSWLWKRKSQNIVLTKRFLSWGKKVLKGNTYFSPCVPMICKYIKSAN